MAEGEVPSQNEEWPQGLKSTGEFYKMKEIFLKIF